MGREIPDLLPGTLELLILKTLVRGPMHGYAIAQRLRQLLAESLILAVAGAALGIAFGDGCQPAARRPCVLHGSDEATALPAIRRAIADVDPTSPWAGSSLSPA